MDRGSLNRFFLLLGEPLEWRSRFVLGALILPLTLSFAAPLWTLRMHAPQYPSGLELEIYTHTVAGDVNEINTLNHYIGMERIDRVALTDLDWLPFAIGGLALLTLRGAFIGDLRGLIDLFMLFVYFSGFSLARFTYKLYSAGHDLNPHAPFKVEPFMPPMLGTEQIANFTVTSLPGLATLGIGLFGAGLLAVLVWNLRLLPRRPPEQRERALPAS